MFFKIFIKKNAFFGLTMGHIGIFTIRVTPIVSRKEETPKNQLFLMIKLTVKYIVIAESLEDYFL